MKKASKTHGAAPTGAKIIDQLQPDDAIDVAAILAEARARAYTSLAPAEAFAHFRPQAEAIPAEGVALFKGVPLLMLANVQAALAVLTPELPTAVRLLRAPRVVDVLELPSLVMGLEFASQRVPSAAPSAGDIDRMLEEGSPWRALALDFLEVLANPLVNLVPAERVKAIREGHGKLDRAQDFVAIAGVFQEFAPALVGKNPIPAAGIARLGELGATLLQALKPGNARRSPTTRAPEAVLRDQFAALVEARYDHLRVIATVVFGAARAGELLPALRSAAVTAPSERAAPTPTPTPNG